MLAGQSYRQQAGVISLPDLSSRMANKGSTNIAAVLARLDILFRGGDGGVGGLVKEESIEVERC